jgi:hypothetical protein
MAFGSFFKTPSHKEFHYRPRYHDPDMDDLHRRVRRAELELKGPGEGPYIPNIKGKMKQHLISQKVSTRKHNLVRLIIISVTVVLLIMIFYFLIEITGFLY